MKPKVFVTRHLPESAWNKLVEACEVESWDETFPPPYDLLIEKVADKEGLVCLLTDKIDANLMDAGSNLKVISQIAVGYDNIDIPAATERKIAVGNTPGVLTDATADFAFTLLTAAARRVVEGMDYVRDDQWKTWGLTLLLGQDISGATLGIVGMGRIGQAMVKRAAGFDMDILYFSKHWKPEIDVAYEAEYVNLDTLLQESDYISLHVNLTDETHKMIDADAFKKMKKTAVLINTARGPVVDTEALYHALKNGQIAYAALDVTDPEPLPADHKLLTLPNIVIAPHIASATITSRTKMAAMAVDNLIAGVNGKPLPFPVNDITAHA